MIPQQHLSDELILDYAAGAAPEPVALLVATHLALCPLCRRNANRLERIGGAMLDSLAPEPIAADALERALARVEQMTVAERSPQPTALPVAETFPMPLRHYLAAGVEGLAWRRVVNGVEEAVLPCSSGRFKATLLKIAAGRTIPRHSHRGIEMLMVLDGSFSDESGRYARGDVEICDDTITHCPVAGGDRDCLCLAVSEGPIRLTGVTGWLVNPFLRR